MLPEDLLVEANASLATTREALRLVGPLAGAGLYTAVGGGAVALIDVVSFLSPRWPSHACGTRGRARTARGPLAREFFAGVHHLGRDACSSTRVISLGIACSSSGSWSRRCSRWSTPSASPRAMSASSSRSRASAPSPEGSLGVDHQTPGEVTAIVASLGCSGRGWPSARHPRCRSSSSGSSSWASRCRCSSSRSRRCCSGGHRDG